MEQTVDAINLTMNQILNEIFDGDIQVILKTHKDLKTKDVQKLQVNFQIIYKGANYDSPSRLSGGEQDRISLALTLAMAKISDSPILLLDECMAALNQELQEKCIEAIQKYITGKTILHICHNAVKGQHDFTQCLCEETE